MDKSNTTGATSGTGTATLPEHLNSPPCLVWGLHCSIFSFLCSILGPLGHCIVSDLPTPFC